MKRAPGLLLALTFSVLWLGCAGDTSSSSSSSTSTPTPTLLSISPSNAQPGGSDFTITATGTNFIPAAGDLCGSEICFNHSLRSTSFVSSTQLTATIPAALIAQAGTVPVFIVSNCEVTSNTLTFNIGSCSPVVTQRVSVASSGSQSAGQGDSPGISGNGRFAVFESNGSDLVAGDTNGADDIFMRDTCLGATSCTPSTIRISVDSSGMEGNGDSSSPNVSDDGRYVLFRSDAINLVTGDTNGFQDIFLRDTCIGAGACTPSTIRVSVDSGGAEALGGDSFDPFISDDGRFVVFTSGATNLVTGDGNSLDDIFLRDTCIGAGACTPSTIRVSVDSGGVEANGASENPHIGATGRFVVFQSLADNLVTGDGNFTSDVFLRDTCIGAGACTPSTIRLSVSTGGVEGIDFSEEAFVSDDGRFVSFGSFSNNLVSGDINGTSDIFVRDTCIGAGACTPSTTAASVSTGGTLGNSTSFSGRISPTGRFVVYDSGADNLVSGDTNLTFDVFIRDACFGVAGCTASTTRLSVDSSLVQGDGFSHDPFISDNGAFVVLRSFATNLVSGDTNGTGDIFVAQTCF